MTTNLKPGMKIRVVVPLTPGDDTPFAKRQNFRNSQIEGITDTGLVHETEGTLQADRLGIDFELAGVVEEPGADLCVVRTASGPVLATFIRASGRSVELYSEQMTPPGLIVTSGTACGKHWDWLKGRTIGEVYKTLPEVFQPNQPQGEEPQPPPAPTAKKRGPKPRAPMLTAETKALPAAEQPPLCHDVDDGPATVSASDGKLTFRQRLRLWYAATELVRLIEAEADDLRVQEAASTMHATITNVCAERGHV
jgi:hypothetical protein